ncbi:MAG: molybdopterin-guanine dinucleotide biosynthesis protein B [Magnetococcus sp. MYC-9]
MSPLLPVPVLGFAASSGSGKTTLMVGVIRQLRQAGLRVAAIKHGHHPANPDQPGKDSHRFRQAGAATVLFATQGGWFLIQDLPDRQELTLEEQLYHLRGHDLVLVEGYKNGPHPKILVHRLAAGVDDLRGQLTSIVAIVSDDPGLVSDLPCFSLDDIDGVTRFIRRYCRV